MPERIIRTFRHAHCKKGPARCAACREENSTSICLLELYPPGDGLAQRRMIEVTRDGASAWFGYEVVRAFAGEEEARAYAKAHGIGDVAL